MLKSEKTEIIKKYARHEGDTGSPEVQIAVLTKRINDLTEHLRTNQKVSVIQPMPVLCDPARPSAVMPVQPSESQPANSDGTSYQAYSVKSNER